MEQNLRLKLIIAVFMLFLYVFAGLGMGSCQKSWGESIERDEAAKSAADGYCPYPRGGE